MASHTPPPRGLVRRLRSAVAPAAKRLLLKGGGYAALRRLRPSDGVAILRYHAICEPDAGYADPGICVSPRSFEAHVRYLADHYSVLSLPAVVTALRSRRPLPANAVVVTFDDGYADNLEAARVLHRHGCTGTFYLTSGCLADGEPFWPAELRALVPLVAGPALRLDVAGQAVDVALNGDRSAAVRQLTRICKSHPIPVRDAVREQLRDAAGRPPVPSVMLTWDQVREMDGLGMTIGAHTVTHPNLPSAGPADAAREIAGARARLEAEIGGAVDMFSYPNGGAERYYTPELQRIVREAGYASAVTSANGFAGPASDLYGLERVQVAERLEDLVFALEVERFAFRPVARTAPGR